MAMAALGEPPRITVSKRRITASIAPLRRGGSSLFIVHAKVRYEEDAGAFGPIRV